MPPSNYDKNPFIQVKGREQQCLRGWPSVIEQLREGLSGRSHAVVAVECYTGLHDAELIDALSGLTDGAELLQTTREFFLPEEKVLDITAPYSGGDDPLFGFMTRLAMGDFIEQEKAYAFRHKKRESGVTVVYGPGASLVCEPDILVYADMPRWEGQLRQRRGEVVNLGLSNKGEKASLQYKRAFYIDWRVCDKLKRQIWDRIDFFLDTTQPGDPRIVTGDALRDALCQASQRPFRLTPFFDPGPWGGQWMKEKFQLDPAQPNYAWCFDCVPEENSLMLRFGDTSFETPGINLVFQEPENLLGLGTYGRFGPEFPIRFNFLDTMGGANLSYQVHPFVDYARENFGIPYTQDESYYILDAKPNGTVYLGLREDADPGKMLEALDIAQTDPASPFPAEDFTNVWPAKKHDHFLIPAGTIHCSGADTMVLEISHTPYMFTFKLWDWGRLGLDGLPRPINLDRGRKNIKWSRRENWVRKNLINKFEPIAEGDGWREERTGLYPSEALETRRHWFSKSVPHKSNGEVNVLNLVQGSAAVVESPSNAFEPFEVHYAETFVVPAAAGDYIIRPLNPGEEMATIKAYIRTKG